MRYQVKVQHEEPGDTTPPKQNSGGVGVIVNLPDRQSCSWAGIIADRSLWCSGGCRRRDHLPGPEGGGCCMEQTPQHGGEHIDVFTSIDLCDLCGKRGGGGV